MRSYKSRLVALFGLPLIVAAATFPLATAFAAPREWKDATGSFSVRAELVELKDGVVHLKRADGEVITVPVNRLSEGDRNYLSNRPKTKPVTETPAEPKEKPEAKPSEPAGDDADKPSLIKLADTSGDGKIARTEWSKFVQNFREYDKDKDSALDESELEATGASAELLALADADQDKKVTRTEWAGLSQSFAKLDKNRDAALDAPEVRGAAETSLARATGTATLRGTAARAAAGPTIWRGTIEGRAQIELIVTGDTIVGRQINPGGGSQDLGKGTFTMTGDGRSGNMDPVYTEGPQVGQRCMGIYILEGDTLRWNVNNRGQRPVDFSGGNGNWPMTLTRVVNP
jgi:uncharacterized protein (TIGR03067 family)